MHQKKPRIKSILPIYNVTDTLMRIGAEKGVTADVDNEDGLMAYFISLLDGTRDQTALLADLKNHYPAVTASDVEDGINHLAELNFLEDATLDDTNLTTYEQERFSRNLKYFEHFANLKHSRFAPQERLRDSSVCVLGLGSHGSTIAFQLAAMGVGHIIAVDSDILELINLNRLVSYTEADLGQRKSDIARERLQAFAPQARIETYFAEVGDDARKYIRNCNLVICAVDRPYAQIDRWISKACVSEGIPAIFSAHFTVTGRVYSMHPGVSGCVDCMLEQFLRNDPLFERQFWALATDDLVINAHQAIFAPNLAFISAYVANEAACYLTGIAEPRSRGTMVELRFTEMTSSAFFEWPHYPDCPMCGHGEANADSFYTRLEAFTRSRQQEVSAS